MSAVSGTHDVVNYFRRKGRNRKPSITAVVITTAALIGFLYTAALVRKSMTTSASESDFNLYDFALFETKKKLSSCTEYRAYPFPERRTGLPYLGDVFASHDAQKVTFVGVNRGLCRKDWAEADRFDANQKFVGHRFMCVFDENIHVISEYVHSTRPHLNGFIIQCKIPSQLQSLVYQGQQFTSLHVSLHAIDDLEMERTGRFQIQRFPSSIVTDTPAISGIPVCHPIINEKNVIKSNQFQLTAMTMIKSQYSLNKKGPNMNSSLTSMNSRVEEWIHYHRHQGFDHFLIYDNDEKPHGPLEYLLKPYIEKGIVSYYWFPMPGCITDYEGGMKGWLRREGQLAGSLAALHRWSFSTVFFAHMDVDEFFVPRQSGKKVLDIVKEGDPFIDVFAWKPTVMAPCNGTWVEKGGSIASKWKCLTDWHHADIKLIMRASKMLYFAIHYPILTLDWEDPNKYTLNSTSEGFLAHFREKPDKAWWNHNYAGLVLNTYNDVINITTAD